MPLRINIDKKSVPKVCGCGFDGNTESMIAHMLRVGAYEDGPKGIKLKPETPHGKGDPIDTLIAQVEGRLPAEKAAVIKEPSKLRLYRGLLLVIATELGIAIVMLAAIGWIISIPHLLAGPLSPWAPIVRWAWQHGEVSAPAIAGLGLGLAIPGCRRRLWQIIRDSLAWLAFAMILLSVFAVVVGYILEK